MGVVAELNQVQEDGLHDHDEEEEETTIDSLPNEILAQVFKNLPFIQCEELMLVCRRWESIIDELVGVRFFIGRPSEFWSHPTNRWYPLDKISQIGVSTVSFSDIEDPEDLRYPTPSFKHPYLVRRVSFDGYLRHSTFVHLVEPIRNLAYLELHLSSLEDIDLTRVKLNFPKLQELIISSNNYTMSHLANRNLAQIMVNCTNLLEEPYFPRLVTLRLYIPIVVQRCAKLLRALFHFLMRHNKTMTMFLIRTEVTVSLVTEESEPVEPIDMTPEVIMLKTHSLPLSIFRATFWAGDLPLLEFFRSILSQQRELTWCGFVTHEDFRPFPQHLVRQNYMTLQKLHLSIGVVDLLGNGITLNCAHLKDCHSLEHVGFIGNRTKDNSLGITTPDLINADLMPKTVQFVEIYNILIGKEDVHTLATKLPLLKTLHLENIGGQGELGMTTETLVDVVQENRLIKIGILAGFNEKSLRRYTNKENPALKMVRLLLSRESTPSFVATLYEDGRIAWGYPCEDAKFT